MNKKILTIIATGLTVLATGCTDLDVDVNSQYTEYPSSEAAVEAKMANVYFAMRDCFGRRYMEAMSLSADEHTAVSYSGNWVDSYAYSNTALHAYTYEGATIDWMGVPGRAIVQATEIADAGGDIKYVAPARAMRAFFTYIIMDCFGDAPINDQKYCDEHGFDIRKRQPRAEVAKYLESELLDIIDDLPAETTGDNYGKPNKYMAMALLAKIYINWAVYTASSVADYDAATAQNEKLADCIKMCDQIINSGVFELGPVEYRFKFASNNTELVQNGQIKDFIYAMPYDTNNAQGMQYVRSRAYKDIKNLNPNYFGDKFSQSGGGYITLIPECVDRFCLEGDQRNLMIVGGTVHVYDKETLLPTEEIVKDKAGNDLVLTKEITLVAQDNTIDVGDNLEGWRQGHRSVKWFAIANDYNNGRNLSNDLPIFRFADILLLKAEAIVRGGGSGDAKALFNQVRTYAHAPELDHTPSLEEIYEERGRELFDENWRRNDMIRFGHFEDEYGFHKKGFPNANFDKTHRIFPVSKGDLDTNPLWEQNPGY